MRPYKASTNTDKKKPSRRGDKARGGKTTKNGSGMVKSKVTSVKRDAKKIVNKLKAAKEEDQGLLDNSTTVVHENYNGVHQNGTTPKAKRVSEASPSRARKVKQVVVKAVRKSTRNLRSNGIVEAPVQKAEKVSTPERNGVDRAMEATESPAPGNQPGFLKRSISRIWRPNYEEMRQAPSTSNPSVASKGCIIS